MKHTNLQQPSRVSRSSFDTFMTQIVPPTLGQQFDELSEVGDIIVFSHLRWEFVTQRPQHLLNRLSKGRKILFVEEPIAYSARTRGTARSIQVSPEITVIQPRINADSMIEEMIPVVKKWAKKLSLSVPALWFYSATFVDIADSIDHSIVVYDCMDELSAFLGAPASLIQREQHLLSIADVVFTGGKSLYESKKRLHANVHCFPSSVDKKHFESALKKTTPIPGDIRNIEHPIVGFYGVIDERLDLDLIDAVAAKLPSVHFVIVGPVVKIDVDTLPQRPNIHYSGAKQYSELPGYLKAFDITWMPFALNDATRFISPTKTLEFMAAQKPIVSTAIYDVVRDYANEVKIVAGAHQCVRAIVSYLNETAAQRNERISLEKAVIERTSWDNTAKAMNELLNQALTTKTRGYRAIRPTTQPAVALVGMELSYDRT